MLKKPVVIASAAGIVLSAVLLASFLGRGNGDEPVGETTSEVTAESVLAAMVATYREATSYRDRGLVRLRYRVGTRWVEDTGRLAVKFERPNRLMLNAYQLKMSCDGRQLLATIEKSGSPALDSQLLSRSAPPTLSLDDVYADPMVLNVIGSGMGGPPVTLELLTSDSPIREALAADGSRELLEPGEVQGRVCHRVRVTVDEGALTMWIDRQDHVLRRLDYPTGPLVAQMQQSVDCSEVTLTVDFRDARINAELTDEDFCFEPPAQAVRVAKFVIPPQPLPTKLLGETTSDFFFTDLQGERVTRESLLKSISVLVWFNNHPSSQACLQQLATVQRGFDRRPQIRFLGVCTEPTTLSHRQVETLVQSWGVQVATVRDLEAFGRDVFSIPWAPTLVVLDNQGKVQWFEVGANPLMQEQLPAVLERLLAGEDVAAETLTAYEQQQQIYQAALSEAAGPEIRQARSTGDGGL